MNGEGGGRLERLCIRGYRSIKEMQVDFGKVNILIGSNGAGKSNFISSFALLGKVLSGEMDSMPEGDACSALFYSGGEKKIALEAVFGDMCSTHLLALSPDCTIALLQERFFRRIWENGAETRREVKRDELAPAVWAHRFCVYHFHDVGAHSAVKGKSRIDDAAVLRPDAANLAAFLYRLQREHEQSYTEIVHTLRLIAPYFDEFALYPCAEDSALIELRWKQQGLPDLFGAAHFSDGTLRFLCLATLLLQPEALQPTLIIIDEPELGLHPYALTIFAESIGQLSDARQILISTQSVELLGEFAPEDVLVADRNADGSVFHRLDITELEGWLEAGYSLGDLWKKNLLGGRLSR